MPHGWHMKQFAVIKFVSLKICMLVSAEKDQLPSLGGGGGAGISRFSLLSLGAAMAAAGAVLLVSCAAGRQNMAGAGLEPGKLFESNY